MEYFTTDNWAYYDLKRHMYVLKPEFIRDNYSIELLAALDTTGSHNAKKAVEGFLRRASMVMYNYIYRHHQGQVEYMRYRLARYPEYRFTLLEGLGELVYSWIINNNDLTIQNGVSIELGKLYERLDAIENTVPVSTRDILYNGDITTRYRWTYDQEFEDDKPAKGLSW